MGACNNLKLVAKDLNVCVQAGALTAAVQKEILTEADRLEVRNKVRYNTVLVVYSTVGVRCKWLEYYMAPSLRLV